MYAACTPCRTKQLIERNQTQQTHTCKAFDRACARALATLAKCACTLSLLLTSFARVCLCVCSWGTYIRSSYTIHERRAAQLNEHNFQCIFRFPLKFLSSALLLCDLSAFLCSFLLFAHRRFRSLACTALAYPSLVRCIVRSRFACCENLSRVKSGAQEASRHQNVFVCALARLERKK